MPDTAQELNYYCMELLYGIQFLLVVQAVPVASLFATALNFPTRHSVPGSGTSFLVSGFHAFCRAHHMISVYVVTP